MQIQKKYNRFLNDLLESKPAALKEFAELTAFAKELDGIDHQGKMGWRLLSEKLKQKIIQFG